MRPAYTRTVQVDTDQHLGNDANSAQNEFSETYSIATRVAHVATRKNI